jgi:thiopurine S-methyltransferase
MRERYARHLVDILPRGTQTLLVTFDYRQSAMQGPTFAVSRSEVEALYDKYADIACWSRQMRYRKTRA